MIDKNAAVFLTGATGFIGSNLASHLLLSEPRRIFCLVRPQGEGQMRLLAAVSASARAAGVWAQVQPELARLIAVPGDLMAENLGLSAHLRTQLSEAGIGEVWHCAASMRFEDYHRDEILASNVTGTERTLNLARALGAEAFYYMSTAYVAGASRGIVRETAHDPTVPANNLYEESKRQAEYLVAAAVKRFRVKILRPSIVVGSTKTLDATSEFGFYGFLAGLHAFAEQVEDKVPGYLATHPLRLLWEPGTTANLMPIDILVQEALAIARAANDPLVYHHLTNPFPIGLEQIHQSLGPPIRRLHELTLDLVTEEDSLRPLDHLFHGRLRFYTPYLMNDKRFERSGDKGCPPDKFRLTEATVSRYAGRFLDRLQDEMEQRAKKRAQALHGLERVTFRCRMGEPLTYHRKGDGFTVVLINAYGVSLGFWEHVIAALLPSYKILTWECRGCSANGADRAYSITEHAEDLREILEREGVQEAHLLAWCTGPKVALEFQNRYPKAVASMTFITGSFAPLDGDQQLLTRYDQVLGKVSELVCRRPEMASVFLRTLTGILTESHPQSANSDADLHELMGMVASRFRSMIIGPFLSERVIANYARMICDYQQHSISHLLESADTPTLLICAENDIIAHPDGSAAAAKRMPDARCVRLSGASHWCLLETSAEITDKIGAFLARPRSRRDPVKSVENR